MMPGNVFPAQKSNRLSRFQSKAPLSHILTASNEQQDDQTRIQAIKGVNEQVKAASAEHESTNDDASISSTTSATGRMQRIEEVTGRLLSHILTRVRDSTQTGQQQQLSDRPKSDCLQTGASKKQSSGEQPNNVTKNNTNYFAFERRHTMRALSNKNHNSNRSLIYSGNRDHSLSSSALRPVASFRVSSSANAASNSRTGMRRRQASSEEFGSKWVGNMTASIRNSLNNLNSAKYGAVGAGTNCNQQGGCNSNTPNLFATRRSATSSGGDSMARVRRRLGFLESSPSASSIQLANKQRRRTTLTADLMGHFKGSSSGKSSAGDTKGLGYGIRSTQHQMNNWLSATTKRTSVSIVQLFVIANLLFIGFASCAPATLVDTFETTDDNNRGQKNYLLSDEQQRFEEQLETDAPNGSIILPEIVIKAGGEDSEQAGSVGAESDMNDMGRFPGLELPLSSEASGSENLYDDAHELIMIDRRRLNRDRALEPAPWLREQPMRRASEPPIKPNSADDYTDDDTVDSNKQNTDTGELEQHSTIEAGAKKPVRLERDIQADELYLEVLRELIENLLAAQSAMEEAPRANLNDNPNNINKHSMKQPEVMLLDQSQQPDEVAGALDSGSVEQENVAGLYGEPQMSGPMLINGKSNIDTEQAIKASDSLSNPEVELILPFWATKLGQEKQVANVSPRKLAQLVNEPSNGLPNGPPITSVVEIMSSPSFHTVEDIDRDSGTPTDLGSTLAILRQLRSPSSEQQSLIADVQKRAMMNIMRLSDDDLRDLLSIGRSQQEEAKKSIGSQFKQVQQQPTLVEKREKTKQNSANNDTADSSQPGGKLIGKKLEPPEEVRRQLSLLERLLKKATFWFPAKGSSASVSSKDSSQKDATTSTRPPAQSAKSFENGAGRGKHDSRLAGSSNGKIKVTPSSDDFVSIQKYLASDGDDPPVDWLPDEADSTKNGLGEDQVSATNIPLAKPENGALEALKPLSVRLDSNRVWSSHPELVQFVLNDDARDDEPSRSTDNSFDDYEISELPVDKRFARINNLYKDNNYMSASNYYNDIYDQRRGPITNERLSWLVLLTRLESERARIREQLISEARQVARLEAARVGASRQFLNGADSLKQQPDDYAVAAAAAATTTKSSSWSVSMLALFCGAIILLVGLLTLQCRKQRSATGSSSMYHQNINSSVDVDSGVASDGFAINGAPSESGENVARRFVRNGSAKLAKLWPKSDGIGHYSAFFRQSGNSMKDLQSASSIQSAGCETIEQLSVDGSLNDFAANDYCQTKPQHSIDMTTNDQRASNNCQQSENVKSLASLANRLSSMLQNHMAWTSQSSFSSKESLLVRGRVKDTDSGNANKDINDYDNVSASVASGAISANDGKQVESGGPITDQTVTTASNKTTTTRERDDDDNSSQCRSSRSYIKSLVDVLSNARNQLPGHNRFIGTKKIAINDDEEDDEIESSDDALLLGKNQITNSKNGSNSSSGDDAMLAQMDISAAHLILSYMEKHMEDKKRLRREWDELSAAFNYQNNSSTTNNNGHKNKFNRLLIEKRAQVALSRDNKIKNRSLRVVPFDKNRVKLGSGSQPLTTINNNGVSQKPLSDYINASYIYDDNPRRPTHIISQGPLESTVAHFWQMVWEQGVSVIVMLTRLNENSVKMCHSYWPTDSPMSPNTASGTNNNTTPYATTIAQPLVSPLQPTSGTATATTVPTSTNCNAIVDGSDNQSGGCKSGSSFDARRGSVTSVFSGAASRNLQPIIANGNVASNVIQFELPNEASGTTKFEVHLVSEHVSSTDYLVRNMYIINRKSGETRTITQFHYIAWPENGVPANVKNFLQFRRKVNKSYRDPKSPILVHCSDGAGRSGTYTLIDIILERIKNGTKEIDPRATLEHLREQRVGLCATQKQFEFVLVALAEEIQLIIDSLPQ